ncbi:MAG: formylglycine-generating enzyme family protein [Gammaproteobacteria bacterium (ex Lamellibrachia satsuma)]|nr:MAG: formylglycine-generating enzyme family protein [Gammaproteobacteria bacterium (ex Lamellibrachia satsuma)]
MVTGDRNVGRIKRSVSGSSLDSQQRVTSNGGMEIVETTENNFDKAGQKATILLPDIDWVEIPAGEFLYGEERETRYLDSFQISRYPVTNAQYQTFIDTDGYKSDEWWEGLEKPVPKESRWKHANRPRINVNWYEAVAFTRWLSEMLNQSIRLPNEEEWEKAARGSDGRAFPWGEEYINGYANVDESLEDGVYLKQTSAVGLYPQGASPYGVEDMAGNVWEWCLNKYQHSVRIDADSSGNDYVLRGGAWNYGPDIARAALRGRRYPTNIANRRGIRLLLSASILNR